jgi:AcrR family transcriptional regulator
VSATALIDATAVPLRNEPVQARSTARLAALLDAAAAVVDEIGYERLTTAMVAERAGASIGTVYRYFPDRIAVLQALGARNLDRVLARAGAEISDPKHDTWFEALGSSFGLLVEMYRSEPGFRSLRVGDVIDLHPATNERTYNSIVADALMDALVARFGLTDTPESRFAFETALEVSDALASRAFARDVNGDEKYMEAGRQATIGILAPHFGLPQ